VSVLGLPKNPESWRKPPFKFHDPDTGKVIQINDAIDQHRTFNSWADNHFEFSLMLAHPLTFIDKGVQDVIHRLKYCERFHVPPFPGDFTEHPGWWKRAVIIIDRAFMQAEAYRDAKKKVTSGKHH